MECSARTAVTAGAGNGFGANATQVFSDKGYRVRGKWRDAATKLALEADMQAPRDRFCVDIAIIAHAPQGAATDLHMAAAGVRWAVGLALGDDQIDALTQPLQDAILKDMQIGVVPDGTPA